MTLPKTKNACPICMKTYAAMSKHLKTSHGVLNLKERQILLNLASNRVNIRRQPCPVMGCNYDSTRLDQHIPSCHTELNQAQVQQYLQWARRATTIALLKELRSTDPAVPLASCLDLGLEEEEEEEERYQQVPHLEMMEEPQCPNPDCVAQLRSWRQSSMEYRRRAERSEEELRQLRGMYQQLAKKFNRLSKERGTEATVAVKGREEEQPGTSYVPDEQPGTSYVPDEQPGTSYVPDEQPGTSYVPDEQPGTSYVPDEQPGTSYVPDEQPGTSYVPDEQPGTSYVPDEQPGTSYVPDEQPGTSYVPDEQPGTSYVPDEQPGTSYVPDEQPGTSYVPDEQPGTSYVPDEQPGTSYVPDEQPGTSYVPDEQPGTSYVPDEQPGTSYVPDEQPGTSYAPLPAPVPEPAAKGGPGSAEGVEEEGLRKVAKRLFAGTGKGTFTRHIKFPESMEHYLKKYQAFHEGSCPSQKHRENAFSKVSRIRSFLAFMAGKDSSLATWRFLDKAEQIIQWPNVLSASGKNVTMANFYLRNVLQFMIYFKETPPKLARLSQSQITGVIRAMRQAIKSVAKKMLAHQLTTKDKKLSKVVSQESLRRCQVGARKAIPKLLKELREDYTVQLRNAFYGYFSAFVASIYGHRPGVFKNMTVAEVRGAATEGRPPTGYVIRVNEHKTSKDFGPAQIFLEPEEYGWLLKWLQVRESCNPAGDRVFFTPGKGPLKNLVRYMQEAWAEMGLPGNPTFIDLRTAVSAHAKNVHAPEVRSKVAKFMCHNTTTADRYYALHMDMEQSRAMRRHFEEASTLPRLGGSPSSPPKAKKVGHKKATAQEESDSTSVSDEAVPFQDSGDSCLEEERWELEMEEEEEGREEEEGQEEQGEEEEEDVTAGPAASTPVKTQRREMYKNLMVRLSPLESSFKASRRALRAARRAALKSPRTGEKKEVLNKH